MATLTTRLVLASIRSGHHYGLDIIHHTRLASSTVYPILRRLTTQGCATYAWEEDDPIDLKRPRRKNYVLTAAADIIYPPETLHLITENP